MGRIVLQCLAVGAAGFAGAVARFLIGTACGRWFSTTFPIGTLVVNLTGSVLLGWFMGVVVTRTGVPDTLRLAVASGFIGAYTTFSTLMYETDALVRQGSWYLALVNVVGSLLLGLAAVRLGAYMAGA
jgi:CrcB protein